MGESGVMVHKKRIPADGSAEPTSMANERTVHGPPEGHLRHRSLDVCVIESIDVKYLTFHADIQGSKVQNPRRSLESMGSKLKGRPAIPTSHDGCVFS
jgi:hypothetical protein